MSVNEVSVTGCVRMRSQRLEGEREKHVRALEKMEGRRMFLCEEEKNLFL